MSASVAKYNPHDAAYAQIRTWLLTGELYLRLGQVDAAEMCCTEARQVFPLSYLILYLRGAIHQSREEWEEAKTCLQNSLSIYPRHLASLQALGLLHLRLGSPRLGELALRAAIRFESSTIEINVLFSINWNIFSGLSRRITCPGTTLAW